MISQFYHPIFSHTPGHFKSRRQPAHYPEQVFRRTDTATKRKKPLYFIPSIVLFHQNISSEFFCLQFHPFNRTIRSRVLPFLFLSIGIRRSRIPAEHLQFKKQQVQKDVAAFVNQCAIFYFFCFTKFRVNENRHRWDFFHYCLTIFAPHRNPSFIKIYTALYIAVLFKTNTSGIKFHPLCQFPAVYGSWCV